MIVIYWGRGRVHCSEKLSYKELMYECYWLFVVVFVDDNYEKEEDEEEKEED